MPLTRPKQKKSKRTLPPPGRKLTTAEARELSQKRFSKAYRLLAK